MKKQKIYLSIILAFVFILSLLIGSTEVMAAKKKNPYLKAKKVDIDLNVFENRDKYMGTTLLSYKKKYYVNIKRVSYFLKDNEELKFDVKIGRKNMDISLSEAFSDDSYEGPDLSYEITEEVKLHDLIITIGNKKIKEKALRIKGNKIINTYLPLDFFKKHIGFSVRKKGDRLLIGEKIYPQIEEYKVGLTSNGQSENMKTLCLLGEKYIYLGDLKRLVKNTKAYFGYTFDNENNSLNILYYDREKGDESIASFSSKPEGEIKKIKLYADYFGKLRGMSRNKEDLTNPLDNISDRFVNTNAMIVGDKVFFSLNFICDFMNFEQKTEGKDIILDNHKREDFWVLKSQKGTENSIYEENGTIVAVRADRKNENGTVTVQKYFSDFSLQSEKILSFEGEKFGGFFNGTLYNFILFGNDNEENSDDKVTYHLVKYDKDFNRLDSLRIKGAYTTIPFDLGSVSMAESGNSLVIHTAKKRYDGHQSQMTFIVSISSMSLMNGEDIGAFQLNHVSHSFDQRVKIDESKNVYLLDQGDGYPRSLVMTKMMIENEKFIWGYRKDGRKFQNDRSLREKKRFDIIKFPGGFGANDTGFSLGSMVEGSKNFLIGGNHIDYGKVTSFDEHTFYGEDLDKRDAYIFVVNKEDPTLVNTVKLTDYAKESKRVTYSPVRIAKIEDNKYVALWNEYNRREKAISVKDEVEKMKEKNDSTVDTILRKMKRKYKWKSNNTLCYQYLDQEGNLISEMKKLENMEISYTEPVVVNGNIIWTNAGAFNNYGSKEDKILFTLPVE